MKTIFVWAANPAARIARVALVLLAQVVILQVLGSRPVVAQSKAAQSKAEQEGSSPVVREFVSGGQIKMNLESGGYDVKPGTDNQIRISWNHAGAKDVRVKLNINGPVANLEVQNTPNNFHATIEVPANADLRIRLTAGALTVGRIKGNKDVESNAGDVNIAVGEANEWSKVAASVRAGNLDAAAFNVSKGGLFRSFDWSGPGKYRLEVHLMAGNLSLHK
jgi:hypothetical protein